jgi:hypothetical protein
MEKPPQPAPATPPPPVPRQLPWALALVALLVRLPFLTHLPLPWDAVQFTLGVMHYSVALHQPHPPGYFLYVRLAQLLYHLGFSPYGALVAVSVVSGAVMTGLLTWWAGKLAGRSAALGTGALCVVSPLAWWMAVNGLSYGPAGCAAAAVGYLCWRLYTRPGEAVGWSALALGVAGGFRPQDAALLFPLWLLCATRRGWRPALLGLVILGAVTAAWVGGMLASGGGLLHAGAAAPAAAGHGTGLDYVKYVWSQMPWSGHWVMLRQNANFLGSGLGLMLMVAWIFVCWGRGTELTRRGAFLGLWLAPALAFFLLGHIGQLGYVMVIFPPVALLAGLGLGRLMERSGRVEGVMLLLVVTGMMAFFTGEIIYVTQRTQEADYRRLAAACAPYLGPNSIFLTTAGPSERAGLAPRPVLSYRAAMYLLPEAHVYRFPLEEAAIAGGPNAGFRWESAKVPVPLTLSGVRHLLLTDADLLNYLPPGTAWREVAHNAQGVVLVVELDPRAPLILGPDGHLQLRTAAGR